MHTVFSLLSNTDPTTPGTYTNLGIPIDLPNIFCQIGEKYGMVGGMKLVYWFTGLVVYWFNGYSR